MSVDSTDELDEILKPQFAFVLGLKPDDIHPNSLTQQCISEAKAALQSLIEDRVEKHLTEAVREAKVFAYEDVEFAVHREKDLDEWLEKRIAQLSNSKGSK